MTKFKTNDLVWAKIKGYPYWPGLVADPLTLPPKLLSTLKLGKNNIVVFFPDSENHSAIPEEFVHEYEAYREEYCKTKTKAFKKALDYFEEKYRISKQDSNSVSLPTENESGGDLKNVSKTLKDVQKDTSGSKMLESSEKDESISNERLSNVESTKIPSTPQQWSNTVRAKDYTRTPFESRKRPTTSTPIAAEGKLASPEPGKKAKVEELQEVTKQEMNNSTSGNIGVLGSGPAFQAIVQALSFSSPVKYLSKSPISLQPWAAHCKPEAKDIVSNCKYLFVHFTNIKEAENFFFSKSSTFYNELDKNKFVLNLSPFKAEYSKQINVEVSRYGAKYIECSMLFSQLEEIRNRKISIIVSGNEFTNVQTHIQKLSSHITYVGKEIGKTLMFINGLNAISVGCSAVVREVCSSLYSSGVDLKQFDEILQTSNVSSNSLSTWMNLIRNDQAGSVVPAVHSSFKNKEQMHDSLMQILESSTSSPLFLTGLISQLIKK